MKNINTNNDHEISYQEVQLGFRKIEKLLHNTEEVQVLYMYIVFID